MLRATRIMRCSLAVLLLLLSLCDVQARWTSRPRRTTTPRTASSVAPMTTTMTGTGTTEDKRHGLHWHPAFSTTASPESSAPPVGIHPPPQPPPAAISGPGPSSSTGFQWPYLVEEFDQRALDGHYEYRYQLSNGDTRYERAYWLPVGKQWVLAKKGYYSIPLPNSKYSTVFYTADHHGYRVDRHTLSGAQPVLPRTLQVPQAETQTETKTELEQKKRPAGSQGQGKRKKPSGAAAKRNSISVPERNEAAAETKVKVEEGQAGAVAAAAAATAADASWVKPEHSTEEDILASETHSTDDGQDDDDDDADADDADDVDAHANAADDMADDIN